MKKKHYLVLPLLAVGNYEPFLHIQEIKLTENVFRIELGIRRFSNGYITEFILSPKFVITQNNQ